MRIAKLVAATGLACTCLIGVARATAADSTAGNPAAPAAPTAPPADPVTAQPAPMVQAAPAHPATVTLRANSLVPLRMLQSLSSDATAPGTRFKLEVTDDINVEDTIVIPAGSIAEGEVIHAAKSGMLGKAGELSISARVLYVGTRTIRLHAALGTAGANKTNLAFFIPFARGGKVEVPEGTELIARVAADETFPATPTAAAPSAAPTPGDAATTAH